MPEAAAWGAAAKLDQPSKMETADQLQRRLRAMYTLEDCQRRYHDVLAITGTTADEDLTLAEQFVLGGFDDQNMSGVYARQHTSGSGGTVPPKTSKQVRVMDPAEATSGRQLQLPAHWSAGMRQWVARVQAQRPLRVDAFRELFDEDPDGQWLVNIIQDGVAVCDDESAAPQYNAGHYPSLQQHQQLARQALQGELRHDQIVQPPQGVVSPYCHAVGAVPKSSGAAVRLVHDFSRPVGAALNDQMHHLAQRFTRVQDILPCLPRGGWAFKLDLWTYFMQIPVHPAHWPLLAFEFEGVQYWGTRVLNGLRNGPEIAQRITAAVVRLMRKMGYDCTFALLDDFYCAVATEQECWGAYTFLCAVFAHLGFVINFGAGKTCGPAQVQRMLGVELDLVRFEARLDAQRVSALEGEIHSMMALRKVIRRDADSLMGKVVWASAVVEGGMLFLNDFRSAVLKVSRPHHRVTLTRAALNDLAWWAQAVQLCNGICACPQPATKSAYTDARGADYGDEPGIGVFVDGGFVSLSASACMNLFDDTPSFDAPIQLWELFAVVVLLRLFGDYLRGEAWQLVGDNSNVTAWLTRGTVRQGVCQQQALTWLKQIKLAAVAAGVRLQPVWIASADNGLADALSRSDWSRFYDLLKVWRVSGDCRSGAIAGPGTATAGGSTF